MIPLRETIIHTSESDNNREGSSIPVFSASKAHWDREYAVLKVIPTSTRTSPSRALMLFVSFFDLGRPLRILDIGAGIGRNAIYLARQGHAVTALDYSSPALAELVENVQAAQLADRIHAVQHDISTSLPFEDARFDVVVDSYVFCHFIEDELKNHYRSEMLRVLRPSGRLFSSVFTPDDEYYNALIADFSTADPVVVDPRNGIAKQLYSERSVRAFFASGFDIDYFARFEFKDWAVNRQYRRDVLVMLMGRR